MKRLKNLFRQFEFHIFLFALFFFLFNWPFLGIFHANRGDASGWYVSHAAQGTRSLLGRQLDLAQVGGLAGFDGEP
jgi:hypothetical protein